MSHCCTADFFRAYVTGDGSVVGMFVGHRRKMAERYKITATIIKPGNLPVQWIRYSRSKMTQAECERMFTIQKEAGRSFGDKVRVEEFSCELQMSGQTE